MAEDADGDKPTLVNRFQGFYRACDYARFRRKDRRKQMLEDIAVLTEAYARSPRSLT